MVPSLAIVSCFTIRVADDQDTNRLLVLAGLFGPQKFGIPEAYFRYFVKNDSSFNIADLNNDLILYAKELNVGQLVSVNPDITAFTKRGGKLLQYHGLSDQLISCRLRSSNCGFYPRAGNADLM